MYQGIKHLHSYTAYLALLFLLIAVGYTLYGWLGKKEFSKTSKMIGLLGLIGAHLQLVFGLIIYFVSPVGFSNISGDAMGDKISRLYFLEHPLMMIIAIVLITIGYSRAKRMTVDASKFKSIFIFYFLGLILILARIPWHAWGK
ncbi:cytochrome B [Portibacter lacus]|uniref:Cytochrome B n=1 Tax=Portibacter lacus TaxID=1099794 RepID=A0AA37SQ21_9BACT|nr:cytochrome B [Portibacter lacus]GLR16821.1 hypothetical protein GCM10007940_14360 [Portibacter lacus]